jgi:SAM-dependent methyltransferase
MPPQRLVVLVAGPTSPESFLRKGRRGADIVRDAMVADGRPLDEVADILDFGVGCGRVARHWQHLQGPRVHGCDMNPELVDWTRAHLPFVAARTCQIGPPLPYPDASFDVVYALSVFTHLPEELQQAWMAELRRVLRPDGRVLLTTHGDAYRDRLEPRQLDAYDRGELVVLYEEVAGSNLCGAYHPPSWVRERMAPGFEVRSHAPEGARANGRQDLWLLRRVD